MTAEDIAQYKPGERIFFSGFMSTSRSLETILFYGTNVIFIIITLSAAHQESLFMYSNLDLHASKVTVMEDEEVLYAPFSSFDIRSVEEKEYDACASYNLELQLEHELVNNGHNEPRIYMPGVNPSAESSGQLLDTLKRQTIDKCVISFSKLS